MYGSGRSHFGTSVKRLISMSRFLIYCANYQNSLPKIFHDAAPRTSQNVPPHQAMSQNSTNSIPKTKSCPLKSISYVRTNLLKSGRQRILEFPIHSILWPNSDHAVTQSTRCLGSTPRFHKSFLPPNNISRNLWWFRRVVVASLRVLFYCYFIIVL